MFEAAWWAERARFKNPGRINPKLASMFTRWVGPWIRLAHRPTIEGIENLPSEGPFLLVCNHSGGAAISELLCLALLSLERFPQVPIAAMAHPLSFHLWPLKPLMAALGAIPSSYEAGHSALLSGVGVLVFPGGDYEATRPLWQADRVDFNNRKGFLKVAQRANCPIIPMGIQGSHASVPILWRSNFVLPWLLILPKLFGLKRYPLTLLGLLGVVLVLIAAPGWLGWAPALITAWLWLASPGPLIPIIPTSIRIRIGGPLSPEELFESQDLVGAYEQVVSRVQALVSQS